MDPLGDPLTTHQIQLDWDICIEPYPNWHFGCLGNPDRHCGKGLVLTWTRTRSDGPKPLLTLAMVVCSLQILYLDCCLVAKCVAWWIGNGGKTEEPCKLASLKDNHYTHTLDEINPCVSQMHCLCLWEFETCHPIILCCWQGIVPRNIVHLVEPE